jgi:hypothetical protein
VDRIFRAASGNREGEVKLQNKTGLKLCCCALLTALAGSTPDARAAAQEIEVAPAGTRIARGQTQRFEFGTVPQKDTTVTLEISSRLDAKSFGGSMYFLKLKLNGRDVNAAKSRSAIRLQNRPLVSAIAPDQDFTWHDKGAGWRVLYAPDFQTVRAPNFNYFVGDPYTLVLDVTDLVNPVSTNVLEISNTAADWAAEAAGTNGDLVFEKLLIKTKPGSSPMMAATKGAAHVINRGTPAAGAAKYSARILPGGGLEIQSGAQRFQFSSAFSFPNAGFNFLTAGAKVDNSGQAEWKAQIQNEKNGGVVTARGREYSVRRAIQFTPRKIEISDAITNATDAPLGLVVRHEMQLDAPGEMAVRLAGNPDPSLTEYFSPGNPSVHIALKNSGLGMICEDDIFRNQAKLFVREDGSGSTPGTAAAAQFAGLKTEMLRLAPGETYELRWSIYPVAGPDYYDFINLVREDWGANYTAEGAWLWGYDPQIILDMPEEELRTKFERQGIRYAIIGGGWGDRFKDLKRIGFGAGVLDEYFAEHRKRITQSAEKIRRVVPGCKVLLYYTSLDDTSENSPQRFADSWRTGPDGKQLYTDWNGEFSRTWGVVATLDNSFGKAMLEVARQHMDEMKMDGLYWDTMENRGFGEPLLTYNQGDGHSCLLDMKTFTIAREVGNTVLLGEAHRLAVTKLVQEKGGAILGNGPICTKDLLATQTQRMTEVIHNDYFAYEGNLQTPLGFIAYDMEFSAVVRALQLATLPVGASTEYSHDIMRHLFPFTPIELHAGYLLGRERIITLHDGAYGWDGDFKYRLWIYDKDGKAREENPRWQTATKRVPIAVPEGGVAIMERSL